MAAWTMTPSTEPNVKWELTAGDIALMAAHCAIIRAKQSIDNDEDDDAA